MHIIYKITYLFFLIYAPNAMAYIDPGVGSLALQYLVAGVFAAILYAKLAWGWTKSLLLRLLKKLNG
jgi:hypothetical protein